MPRNHVTLSSLEELREAGDYDKLAAILSDDWQDAPEWDEETIRARMLAAELAGRAGRLEEMETALSPYLEDINRVPLGLAPRVLLITGTYHYRRNEPTEALQLALQSKTISALRGDEFTMAEAVQLEGQALWSLERWDEAADRFENAIATYASQSRAYRLGLAYLCLGAVLNRMGRVEEARVALERGIKILLKCHDDYNLAVARVNVALALNVIGEYDTALKYLNFAHDTFQRMGHEQYTYLTLNSIASTLVHLKEYDQAESYVSRALEIGAAARSTQIAATYEVKARVHLARREWDRAEAALMASIEIAGQANSNSQKAEARRSLGRLYIAQERDAEAATVLWQALDIAAELRASLLELEIKALLAQAISATNPVEACKLISDVEADLGNRPLPELKKDALAARRRINSLDHEHYFILSDAKIPNLAEAKISLLKWLWARALYKARGNARDAASTLGVTPTYIRKLTKVIPRDLLRPGRKRPKKRSASAQ
ncbi:MAG TPA: tetratricopeptide repeat protein [Blastocatellia bacterium]|nr:tetratricopeptide repeat protein [Blastocatellia bacterium]